MRPSCSGNRTAAIERLGRGLLLGLAVVGAASSGLGCGGACDTADEANLPERYGGGQATADGYESSSWKWGLLPFPGGKQYQLEHHLGFTPLSVEIYIGFGPDGERVAPCAGNSCLIRCVNDEFIWIKNDTCTDFWVRVTASQESFEHRGNSCEGGPVDAGRGDDVSTEKTVSPASESASPDGAGALEASSSTEADVLDPIDAPSD
jgi:hypothetical protein